MDFYSSSSFKASRMFKKFLFSFVVLISTTWNMYGQMAEGYFSMLSQAEKYIVHDEYSKAISAYQMALEKYDYPFYRNIRQAAIVACLSEDTLRLIPLLKKCIERGMTKNELPFYVKRLPECQSLLKLEKEFDFYTRNYEESIDSTVLIPYLELDVLHTHMLKKRLRLGRRKQALRRIREENVYFLEMFTQLWDSLGFPSEQVVGLTYEHRIRPKWWPRQGWRLTSGAFPIAKKYAVKFSFTRDNLLRKGSSSKPGMWGLTHLLVDSSFICRLQTAFDSLQIDQNSITTCLGMRDYGVGRYSRFGYKTGFKLERRYAASSAEKEIIDTNRKEFYIRSLDEEKALFSALYLKQFGEDVVDYDQAARKMGYVFLFFSFYQ